MGRFLPLRFLARNERSCRSIGLVSRPATADKAVAPVVDSA